MEQNIKKEIKNRSTKLYEEISKKGIEKIRNLFSNGENLSNKIKYDKFEEYIKKMIISQLDINKMLLSHKFYNISLGEVVKFKEESEKLRERFNSSETLNFDEKTIEELFENSFNILSDEDYEEWRNFLCLGRRNECSIDDIFLEEKFKHDYEKETKPIKKFLLSFRYKRIQKKDALEDSYVQTVRKIIKKNIEEKPDKSFSALKDLYYTIEKGLAEYESIKDIEDITMMTLASLNGKQGEVIDINKKCKVLSEIAKNSIGDVNTDAVKSIQEQYEKAYNTAQSQEDYIRQISKICANFIYIKPFEDANKITGICLFNSMLLSKGIIPPPISLANDKQIANAFIRINKENDYSMFQDLVVERYKNMLPYFEKGEENQREIFEKNTGEYNEENLK